MPRANRHFLPGYVWHITHRCHERAFLLKFARDRQRYLHWLFEAKKRFGLCVLDYMVTSNHVHVLVRDTGGDVIPRSMQLVAGRMAQEYNRRKGREGAFWEDRYHATAVNTDRHLRECLVYIDLNMVRAGAVACPGDWMHSGYREIQAPRQRYALIDREALSALCGYTLVEQLAGAHRRWVDESLAGGAQRREDRWSEAIAVGSKSFVEKIQLQLGLKARHREVSGTARTFTLQEPAASYLPVFGGKNDRLRLTNTLLWERTLENAET